MKIPFSRPAIGEEEIAEVSECLRSGWITSGPRVSRFESDFAAAVDAPMAVATSSATAALHLAFLALGLKPGDEVITTPMTWPATVNTIVLAGGSPVLADVDPATLNLDPAQIERRLSERTRAIVPVHFAGQPCDMDAIGALATRHGAVVIEDAAHALGTSYRDRKIGSIGKASIFSFHPIKNITTGEGGMVTTADAGLARIIRLHRFHGVERDAWKAYGGGTLPLYDVVLPGLKYNMTDLQAAIGIHQLRKLEGFNTARRRLAKRYDEALAAIPEIRPLEPVAYPSVHAHHLYVVRLETECLSIDRNEIMALLQEAGVGIGLHFTAVHELSYYRERLGDLRDELPIATAASERIFSLPLYPSLSDDEVDRVVEALGRIVSDHRR